VPEENLEVLTGGETIRGGAYKVEYTPGHASHHVSYLHDGTAFVGDVGGVRITPTSMTIPPTPPPDIDVEAWHESTALVRSWRPQRLAMTHFGAAADVEDQLDALDARLEAWSVLARDGGHDAFVTEIQQEIQRDGSPEQARAYEQAAPVEQLFAGYERYWAKKAQPD
ncbi:MAG TPA: hypothetical protein VE571_14395, partial [Solirubrobacteraceae bacterium]|nr:hypothetical protein [Solirubrobacteraceae bacterium]